MLLSPLPVAMHVPPATEPEAAITIVQYKLQPLNHTQYNDYNHASHISSMSKCVNQYDRHEIHLAMQMTQLFESAIVIHQIMRTLMLECYSREITYLLVS